jgi:hypothetical protein
MAKRHLTKQEQLDAIYMQLVDLHEQQGVFDDETNLRIEQKIMDLNADRLLLERSGDFVDTLTDIQA